MLPYEDIDDLDVTQNENKSDISEHVENLNILNLTPLSIFELVLSPHTDVIVSKNQGNMHMKYAISLHIQHNIVHNMGTFLVYCCSPQTVSAGFEALSLWIACLWRTKL